MAVCEWCGSRIGDQVPYCPICGRTIMVKRAEPARRWSLNIDPVYLAAFVTAACSVAFSWVPRLGLLLAGLALIMVIAGFRRHSRSAKGYGGYWINWLAFFLGVYGLAMGISTTLRL